MVAREDIINHKNDIIRIAEEHGAHDIRLFGSVVRGESSPKSDVDILVRMDADRSLLDRISLINELQDLLHCRVDVVNDRIIDPIIRESILAEAMLL